MNYLRIGVLIRQFVGTLPLILVMWTGAIWLLLVLWIANWVISVTIARSIDVPDDSTR